MISSLVLSSSVVVFVVVVVVDVVVVTYFFDSIHPSTHRFLHRIQSPISSSNLCFAVNVVVMIDKGSFKKSVSETKALREMGFFALCSESKN